MDRDERRKAAKRKTLRMYELYAVDGLTLDEVGERFGVGKERVRQRFREMALPTRNVWDSRRIKRRQWE